MSLERHLGVFLQRAGQSEDVTVLEGPRGAGKTTLLAQEFPRHLYVSFDEMTERRAARRNPAAFLLRLRRAAILDDVQRAPELVEHVRKHGAPTPVILGSSRRLGFPRPITLELHPPSLAERQRRRALPIEVLGRFAAATSQQVASPPFPKSTRGLELDIREMIHVHEMERVEDLLEIVRDQSGSVLDQQDIARRIGVAHRTIVRWLEVLDACFLTLRIEPLDDALGRRQIRRPKLHALSGANAFESQVVSEVYRNARHANLEPVLRYWRDSNGLEIPLILVNDEDGSRIPVQIVAQPTPKHDWALRRWMELAGTARGAMIGEKLPAIGRREGNIPRYSIGQL